MSVGSGGNSVSGLPDGSSGGVGGNGNGGRKGPSMGKKPKWLIEAEGTLTTSERRRMWEELHERGDYKDVFSVTEDETFRRKILDVLSGHGNVRSVLVPGCGSRVFLQRDLAQITSIEEICCTDFERVVDIAAQQLSHPKVTYMAKDSADLGYRNRWDAVVVVNSVLSESDAENRAMMFSFYEALRPGGILVGYFPTIFCAVDIDAVDPSAGLGSRIDLKRSRIHEKKQGMDQIFYTPLRLRLVLREAGYRLGRMEVAFCDSDFFIMQGAQYYGFTDPDAVVYELFVVAKKD